MIMQKKCWKVWIKAFRVEYEELSSQVYDYEEEKNLHIGNRDMIDMERENLLVQAEQQRRNFISSNVPDSKDSVSEEKGNWIFSGENRSCQTAGS